MHPRRRHGCARLSFISLSVVIVSLLFASCAAVAEESVMDNDGDGKVSTEEFVEHAQAQVPRQASPPSGANAG